MVEWMERIWMDAGLQGCEALAHTSNEGRRNRRVGRGWIG